MRPRLSSHPWPWHALWTPHPAIKTRGSEERSTDWGFRKEMGGQKEGGRKGRKKEEGNKPTAILKILSFVFC